MQIDLFTFGAQIVNFIILLILLRIFLYKPVINAMNEREEKIAARLREAEKKQEEAQQEAQTYQEKLNHIDEERERLLSEARQDAANRREELLNSAREEVDQRRQQWQQAIQQEKERFLHNLQQRAETQVIAVIRQALDELANAELEAQMTGVFAEQIQDQREAITEVYDDEQEEVVVLSTFSLTDEQREKVRTALNMEGERDLQLRFERDESLVCGIALRTGDYRIGWNLRQYLEALERHLRQTIDETSEAYDEEGEEKAVEPA